MWTCWLGRALINRDLGRTDSPAKKESGMIKRSLVLVSEAKSVKNRVHFSKRTKLKKREREGESWISKKGSWVM